MDDLPVVVLREIFSFLSIEEKFKMRLTCKKWKFVMETMCSQRNVFIYSLSYPYRERWCFSDQMVAAEDLLYMKFNRENSRKFNLKMSIFKNLRKVYLYQIGEKINDFLGELNSLTRLEVLMIMDWATKRMRLRKLSSSSLQKLSIRDIKSDRIELDTPNLHSLVLYRKRMEDQLVNFGFPLTIKHLECTKFTLSLSRLKNLETLLCHEITFDFKLQDFKSLVKLEIFPGNANELEFVKGLQKERTHLDRDRLEIIVSGFKEQLVLRGSQIGKLIQLTSSYLQHALQNSANLVDRLSCDWQINISTLLEYANSIPSGLWKRFRISAIFTAYISNQTRLTETEQRNVAEFIKRSEPKYLCLTGLIWSREFFEQIYSVQSIEGLSIGLAGGPVRHPYLEALEFEHLLRLKNLCRIHVNAFNEKIPLRFLCKLMHLKFFHHFFYRTFGTSVDYEIELEYRALDCNLEPEGHDQETFDRMMACPYRFRFFQTFSAEPRKDRAVYNSYCKDPDELASELNKVTEHEWIKNCLLY